MKTIQLCSWMPSWNILFIRDFFPLNNQLLKREQGLAVLWWSSVFHWQVWYEKFLSTLLIFTWIAQVPLLHFTKWSKLKIISCLNLCGHCLAFYGKTVIEKIVSVSCYSMEKPWGDKKETVHWEKVAQRARESRILWKSSLGTIKGSGPYNLYMCTNTKSTVLSSR